MSKKTSSKEKKPTQERASSLAEISVHPVCSAVYDLLRLEPSADLRVISRELTKVNIALAKGDLVDAEQMLLSQAHVLQKVFSNFIIRAQNADHLDHLEAFGKIALRAQNQCQRTLRTLLEYKNPKRAMFIKQQNNTLNQMINQGNEKNEKNIEPANELLEVDHESRLDPGTQKKTGKGNPRLEAVAKVNRAKVA